MTKIKRDGVVRDMTPEELVEYEASASIPIETLRASAELDRFEFAGAAAAAGFITFAEAAAWAAGNAVPAAVQAIIDQQPAEEQGPIILDVLARPTIRRNAALMPALMAAFQTDDAGVDALFGLV